MCKTVVKNRYYLYNFVKQKHYKMPNRYQLLNNEYTTDLLGYTKDDVPYDGIIEIDTFVTLHGLPEYRCIYQREIKTFGHPKGADLNDILKYIP